MFSLVSFCALVVYVCMFIYSQIGTGQKTHSNISFWKFKEENSPLFLLVYFLCRLLSFVRDASQILPYFLQITGSALGAFISIRHHLSVNNDHLCLFSQFLSYFCLFV